MTIRTITFLPMLAVALLSAGCASQETAERTDLSGAPTTTGVSKTAASQPPSQPSSQQPRGAVSADPLAACMAAIPRDATPGQRALAELTCNRDFGKKDARSVASGTQGDSLQACLARIPKEASAGQRMVAEQSCHRDEEVRKGF